MDLLRVRPDSGRADPDPATGSCPGAWVSTAAHDRSCAVRLAALGRQAARSTRRYVRDTVIQAIGAVFIAAICWRCPPTPCCRGPPPPAAVVSGDGGAQRAARRAGYGRAVTPPPRPVAMAKHRCAPPRWLPLSPLRSAGSAQRLHASGVLMCPSAHPGWPGWAGAPGWLPLGAPQFSGRQGRCRRFRPGRFPSRSPLQP